MVILDPGEYCYVPVSKQITINNIINAWKNCDENLYKDGRMYWQIFKKGNGGQLRWVSLLDINLDFQDEISLKKILNENIH